MTMATVDILTDVEFRIVALIVAERTGREVAAAWEKKTKRPIGAGTLYTTLRRLCERGLVDQKARDQNARARWYVATAAGKKALAHSRKHHRTLATFPRVSA